MVCLLKMRVLLNFIILSTKNSCQAILFQNNKIVYNSICREGGEPIEYGI